MATRKQELGAWGELLVAKTCDCPKCKRSKTLRRLPPNFKCADLICDFCGYLAQVKAMNVSAVSPLPKQALGAAWGPQKERMDAAIYFPLFLVLKAPATHAIYYLPPDFQSPAPDPYLVAKALKPLIARRLKKAERDACGMPTEGIRVMRAILLSLDDLIRDRSQPRKKTALRKAKTPDESGV